MRLNSDTANPVDMPKLHSPFIRDFVDDVYVCTPKVDDAYRWAFTEESEAIEKLDGTNMSIVVKGGNVTAIYNRKNAVPMWKARGKHFMEGLLEAIEKGHMDVEKLEDGQYFGELIGPKVNGNPYGLERHLWLPLDFLRQNMRFKFWDDLVKELNGLSDEEIYSKVSDAFKGLWSLYKRRRGVKGEVDENTVFEGMAAEGIVFYRKGSGEMCKLRRDMFGWFRGRRHG